MLESSHQLTPIAIKPLNQPDDHNLVNETEFQSIVDALQYLTSTRPNISHEVNKVCQHFPQLTLPIRESLNIFFNTSKAP